MVDRIALAAQREENDARKGFIIHFVVYLAVMALLLLIDWNDPAHSWAHWPAIGWGIGVAAHGYMALVRTPLDVSRRVEKARAATTRT